jgi:hypothetical protein
MQLLIKKIYEVFAANADIFTDAGLESVKTIDLHRGQPESPEKFEYFPTPALFLSFNIVWEKSGKIYVGKAVLDTHVVIDNPNEGTANLFTNHEEALKQVLYYRIVRKFLDNLESEESNKMVRAGERPVDTGVIVYNVISHSFNLYETDKLGDDQLLIDDATVQIIGKTLAKKII